MQPIVMVNFKLYERGTGDSALEIARACAQFKAWAFVQAADIRSVAATGVVTWAQHVDNKSFGQGTGWILPEAVKQAGAVGTLLNHSEHRLDRDVLFSTVERCKEVGLQVCVCAESVDEAVELIACKPDFIAIEPPELIGGDVSVVSADPNLISDAVSRLGTHVIVGAGVSTGADLKKAVDDGAAGVLVASAVVKKSDDPAGALDELYSSLR